MGYFYFPWQIFVDSNLIMTGKMESSLVFCFFFASSFIQFVSQLGTTADDLKESI